MSLEGEILTSLIFGMAIETIAQLMTFKCYIKVIGLSKDCVHYMGLLLLNQPRVAARYFFFFFLAQL